MDERPSGFRQVFAAVAGAAAATICLFVWHWLKVSSVATWSEISFFFMPLVIGLAVGWVARMCGGGGSFGFAGLTAITVIFAGLAGAAMQHKLEIAFRLQQAVAAVYAETMAYAKLTVPVKDDDEQLRRAMGTNQVCVIGRLAAKAATGPHNDYWATRNLIHFHWLMTRQLVIYGEGGRDRTLWEASKILEANFFFDDMVAMMAKEPISDEDIKQFRRDDLVDLKKLLNGKISSQEFEASLTNLVNSRTSWNAIAFHGLGPLIGLFILIGAVVAFKLNRQESETEHI